MLNVVIRLVFVFLVFFSTETLSQEAVGEGHYVCNNGCNPSNPNDGLTQEFIRTTVNQDVGSWGVGDYVDISNPSGQTGRWGRANAMSSMFHYMGSGSGGGGTGGGGGGGGGTGGGSGGGSGGGFPCFGTEEECTGGDDPF